MTNLQLSYLFIYLFILFIYLQTFRDLVRFHGEKIIGLEVPYKDLSPMVRAEITGNLCYKQNTTVNRSNK